MSATTTPTAAMITARLDRLPASREIWKLVILLSLGGMFELYDLLMTGYVAPGLVRSGIFSPGHTGLFGLPDQAAFASRGSARRGNRPNGRSGADRWHRVAVLSTLGCSGGTRERSRLVLVARFACTLRGVRTVRPSRIRGNADASGGAAREPDTASTTGAANGACTARRKCAQSVGRPLVRNRVSAFGGSVGAAASHGR